MAKKPDQPIAPLVAGYRGDHLLQQAIAALDSNRSEYAAHLAGEILRTSPRHPRALYVLGCALLMQGRAVEAVAPLQTAARGRHDAEMETMLGIALRAAGRLDDALSQLTRAAKRRPPYAAAFYELGCLLALMNLDEQAIEAFRSGQDVAPMMPQMSTELGYALLRRRRYAEAKACFLRALEISPYSAEASFGIGRAHRELGEAAAAAECFRRVLASRPDDTSIWLELGLCQQELGRADAAHDYLHRAARGPRRNFDQALNALAASPQGRFWLKPSAAASYFRVSSA